MANLSQITSLFEEATREYLFSGYQLYFERRGEACGLSGGHTSYWPEAVPVTDATYFDIGSITKVVTTASSFARLCQSGRASLDDTLGHWVPAFRGSRLEALSLRQILTHASGLAGWFPLFRDFTAAGDAEALVRWFLAHQAGIVSPPPQSKAVYSDLGFMTLGLVLQKTHGDILSAFRDEVATPLRLSEVTYRVPAGAPVAATEYCLWRRRLLQGEVFDENCFALGGIGSHAGLFATARGLAPWVREWLLARLGKSAWLNTETARRFTARSGLIAGSSWGYGWDTKSAGYSGAGTRFSQSSFGHYGYPGCSVWGDPETEGFVILLTNRIHPSRVDERIREFRPRLHDAVAALWNR